MSDAGITGPTCVRCRYWRSVILVSHQLARIDGHKVECLGLCGIHVLDRSMLGVGVSVCCENGGNFLKF